MQARSPNGYRVRAAIGERLTLGAHIIETGTHSYRSPTP
jgi:hypothetical protein